MFKKILCFVVSFVVSVSFVLVMPVMGSAKTKAKAKTASHRLSDYLLNSDKFRELDQYQQTVYLVFLIRLSQTIELAQISEDIEAFGTKYQKGAAKGKRKSSALEFPSEENLWWNSALQSLDGLGPMISPLASAYAAKAIDAPHIVRMRKIWGKKGKKTTPAKHLKAVGEMQAAVEEMGKTSQSLANGVSLQWDKLVADLEVKSRPTEGECYWLKFQGVANGRCPDLGDGETQLTAAKGEALKKIDPESYRQVGDFCLYGGLASKYEAKWGTPFCPPPKAASNKSCSDGSKYKRKKTRLRKARFQCPTYGLQNGPKAAEIKKKLCIRKYTKRGVAGLTKRCGDALLKVIENSPPSRLNKAEYDQFIAALSLGLDKFERDRVGKRKMNFLDYCTEENFANKGRQKEECHVISDIVAKVKMKVPGVPVPKLVSIEGEDGEQETDFDYRTEGER